MGAAIGYGRISSARHDGVSLEIQRERYENWCKSHGYDDCGWFQDAGVSGSKVSRPGLNEMLSTCKRIGSVTVVTREISRIGRTTKLLERIKDAMADGSIVEIQCWDGPSITNDAQGRFTLNIMTSIAEKELEDISSRIKARQAHDRAQGKPHIGGSRPFGSLHDKVTPVPEEVRMIEQAFDHVLSGGSLSSLANRWRTERHLTTTGKLWQYQSLRAMLMSERLDTLIGPRAQMVRLALEERTKNHTVRPSVLSRWLNGTMRCGACGTLLDSHSANGRPAYGCTRAGGCSGVWVEAANIESLFEQFVKHVAVGGPVPDDGYAALLAEQKANAEAADRLTDLYVDGALRKPDFEKRKAKLDAEADRISADLLSVSASAAMRGSVDAWETLDARQKRSVVQHWLGMSVVAKATGKRDAKGRNQFDAERITFERAEVQGWYRWFLKRKAKSDLRSA